MDTSQNQFSNILSALGAQNQPVGASAGKLTVQQEADNYSMFSELMRKGVSLSDLVGKLDTLEAKVKAMEENPNQSRINQELFEVMENAVRGDPAVRLAKQKVADAKSTIISELCMKDTRFREAYDEYRTAVNAAYIRSKEEQASDRETAPEVCHDPSWGVPPQESLPPNEVPPQ